METRNVFIQVIKKPARKHGFTLLRATAFPSEQIQIFVFARSPFKFLSQLSKSIEKLIKNVEDAAPLVLKDLVQYKEGKTEITVFGVPHILEAG